ncbi:hypothetical protein Acr_29g0010510 [Actinidia rufa]|uniref:Uncharacterized protein n=1 Tax=Actinidia rufa TaxID=165716 RepID=A0A7J0HFM7_9ERIC|nr:hypothetical protein Acr_29g0010510 [Actinidia rufa]
MKRFNQAVLEVEDPSDKVVIMAMMEGLCPGPLFDSLSKNVPETLSTLQSQANKYIAIEEIDEAKQRRQGRDDHKRKKLDTRQSNYRDEVKNKRFDRDSRRTNDRHPRTPPYCPKLILPPLKTPIAQVLTEIKHGHNNEESFHLKEHIADLIKKGYLRKYVADHSQPNSLERRYGDNRPTTGDIQVIHGGLGSRGYSSSS